jgi:CO/xanthine dehydrogenase FAD-binding subunit
MDVLRPRSLDDALAIKAERPEALPVCGGTDVLVGINFDRLRPTALLDIARLQELAQVERDDGVLTVGAGVSYTRIMQELPQLTALAQASRTIGSPQIRNRGTVGGNLGTASPAGDALPVLAVYEADVLVADAAGRRAVPWHGFVTDVKRTTLRPTELILGVRFRVPRGPGSFSKIGTRNAMVISIAGLCLQIDEDLRAVRIALGSVAPTIVRATDAEGFAAERMEQAGLWDDPSATLDDLDGFAELVGEAARPIDDVRGTAAFRRHACCVLARRALTWALADRREAAR